jgi:predicted dienelactone hydrolase
VKEVKDMKSAVFDCVTTLVVVVAATTLLAVGMAGTASAPPAFAAPAHLCPPAC